MRIVLSNNADGNGIVLLDILLVVCSRPPMALAVVQPLRVTALTQTAKKPGIWRGFKQRTVRAFVHLTATAALKNEK